MGPKDKKGKQKKAKTPKIEPEKITKTQYLKWIADLNAILAKERTQTEIVEKLFYETEEKFEQRKIDLADVILFLENEIKEKEEEIAQFNDRINILSNDLKTLDVYYMEIINKMDDDFRETKHKLTEQVDYTTAKINALDEVRLHREEFLKKQEALYKLINEHKERQAREIYVSEKKIIIEQDTMRKTMESKIEQLTFDFKEATDIRIGVATNRILRENVKLGNLLTCTQEMMRKMRKAYEKIKDDERKSKFTLELREDECESLLKKYSDQVNKIERLLDTHEDYTTRISNFGNLIKQNRRLKRRINEAETDIKLNKDEIVQLHRVLDETIKKTLSGNQNLKALKRKVIQLQEILYQTAKLTKNALENEKEAGIKKIGEDQYEDDSDTNEAVDSGVYKTDAEREEAMENMKDRCYHGRESIIQILIEKLTNGLPSEDDRALMASWSESFDLSFSMSYEGSVPSLRRPRSSKISTITLGTIVKLKESKKNLETTIK